MKVLVTSGAGYIGSHTVYMIIEKGYESNINSKVNFII